MGHLSNKGKWSLNCFETFWTHLTHILYTFFLHSDEVKRLCKVRDEYFVVKDLVPAKENTASNRNPATGEYPSQEGKGHSLN